MAEYRDPIIERMLPQDRLNIAAAKAPLRPGAVLRRRIGLDTPCPYCDGTGKAKV